MTGRSEPSVLAIDIGGTKIAFAEVRGSHCRDRSQIATPRTGRGADLVAALAGKAAQRGGGHSSPIGVATTGIVENGRLTALNPETLPIENGFPLVEALEAALGRPIVAFNDAQAAAWGEHLYGAGRAWRGFAFVTVSTGVGGGLVVDGRLQLGLSGLAGHLGHMVFDPSGTASGCGRRGCIEAVASGTAIARLTTERLGRPVQAPEVFRLAAAGDAVAERVLDGSAAAIASGLCDLVAAIDVQGIVLGGGVGLAEGFLEQVEQVLTQEPVRFRRPIARPCMSARMRA